MSAAAGGWDGGSTRGLAGAPHCVPGCAREELRVDGRHACKITRAQGACLPACLPAVHFATRASCPSLATKTAGQPHCLSSPEPFICHPCRMQAGERRLCRRVRRQHAAGAASGRPPHAAAERVGRCQPVRKSVKPPEVAGRSCPDQTGLPPSSACGVAVWCLLTSRLLPVQGQRLSEGHGFGPCCGQLPV